MTYFVSDPDAVFDTPAGLELEAQEDALIRSLNHETGDGCIYPYSHRPGHPADMRFRVSLDDSDEWEELTEAEINARLNTTAGRFMAGSQWDFWWEG